MIQQSWQSDGIALQVYRAKNLRINESAQCSSRYGSIQVVRWMPSNKTRWTIYVDNQELCYIFERDTMAYLWRLLVSGVEPYTAYVIARRHYTGLHKTKGQKAA